MRRRHLRESILFVDDKIRIINRYIILCTARQYRE